jgi:hypothetical protein
LDRNLSERTGIYPTGDGGVVVIFAGVAEVLTPQEAFRRYQYALDRSAKLALEHENMEGDPVAVRESAIRAAAYCVAINYRTKSQ